MHERLERRPAAGAMPDLDRRRGSIRELEPIGGVDLGVQLDGLDRWRP